MLLDSTSRTSCLASSGQSIHRTLSATKEDEELHTRSTRAKEPETTICTPSRKDYAVEIVGSRHPRTEMNVSDQSKTPRASCESPRKRCRSAAPTGPKAPIPRRRSSVPIRRKGQDLISFHRQSCRLFQSLEGTLASSQESRRGSTPPRSRRCSTANTRPSSPCIVKTDNGFAYLTSITSMSRFTSPNNSRRNSTAVVTPLPSFYDTPASNTTSSSLSSLAGTLSSSFLEEKALSSSALPPHRPHPVSVLSWTSVESRRLEYEKIDRSQRGFRGLWEKITPRWCHGRCARKGFFTGKDSEVESVRRYRITLDDDGEGELDDYDANDKENRKKRQRKWSCLSLLR
jgi:hypothetical protein